MNSHKPASSSACLTAACIFVLLLSGSPLAVEAQVTDIDILNFALNLEYLEAEFYSWAAFGKGLPAEMRGGGPPSVGGKKAKLGAEAKAYAIEIALDEIYHVRFLRQVLGDQAVPMPQIDIGQAFAIAANAAFNATLTPAFDPYANDLFFYHGAFIFEDVGVTAYKGAAPLLTSKAVLSAAAGLLGTEAYHAGAIRAFLAPLADTMTPYGVPVSAVIAAISKLRDDADGPNRLDKPLINAAGRAILAPGERHRTSFGRSVAQVLSIVTLGGKGGKGGFFPQGLNGKLQ